MTHYASHTTPCTCDHILQFTHYTSHISHHAMHITNYTSHSVLYTYAYNDSVAFQWFAPAGLTRGQVQNATNVGYLNSEGEFVAVALTQGDRDAM